MSRKCLEYLLNSFIYDNSAVESQYSLYTDQDLFEELQRYREFVVSHLSEIQKEILKDNKLNTCIESYSSLPTEEMYRQMVLYMDQIIIPDPLFKCTETHAQFAKAAAQLMGFSGGSDVDRRKIARAVLYLKSVSSLITAGYVVIFPVSLLHEDPKEIPLTYSPNSFSGVIPKGILEYYRSIVQVRNLERTSSGQRVIEDKPLEIGTSIYLCFKDDEQLPGSCFQYVQSRVLDYDEKTGKAQFGFRLADSISEEQFIAWVNQSINQMANHHFNELYRELVLSQTCGCMYLSRSPIVAHVLGIAIDKPTKEAELAKLAMSLDLPLVNNIPLADLLSIRKDYGEAFCNFRNELNTKLLTVDTSKNAEDIQRQLDSISYEISNIQVKEVEKEYRKITRMLKLDALTMVGSLITTYPAGGVTALTAAGAFVKGLSDVGKYYSDVKENNGFFMWKLKGRAEKYSV